MDELLERVIVYLEVEKGKGCICDVLDRMYIGGYLSFREMEELHHYIDSRLEKEELSDEIEQDPNIFINYLRRHIRALRG